MPHSMLMLQKNILLLVDVMISEQSINLCTPFYKKLMLLMGKL